MSVFKVSFQFDKRKAFSRSLSSCQTSSSTFFNGCLEHLQGAIYELLSIEKLFYKIAKETYYMVLEKTRATEAKEKFSPLRLKPFEKVAYFESVG